MAIKKINSTDLPDIRIKDGWLLRANASVHLHELWGAGEPLVGDEWMEKRVKEYQTAWSPFERKILTAMCDITGLHFRQNIIDVYIAPWFNAFSDPMVIGVMQKPDEFVDTLTHELIHRLLTDNTSIPYQTGILLPRWQKLFGKDHDFTSLVHIPVHAVHKAIYVDILKEPKRLQRDIDFYKKTDDKAYLEAWDYVNKHEYKDIIKQLKTSYDGG